MLLFGPLALIVASTSFARATSSSFNDYIEQADLDRKATLDTLRAGAENESDYVQTLEHRASGWSVRHPGLKEDIFQAISKTAPRPHYFWSGRVFPAKSENDSVKDLALTLALASKKGGTTLEGTLKDVRMPKFDGSDADAVDIWQYASNLYTGSARGKVYVVKGESLRPGNVWEVFEYPRLKKMTPQIVQRVFQINYTSSGPGKAVQIWPELDDCDGVMFLDQKITCPIGAQLYYGSQHSPRITAQTTVEKDGAIQVSASGKAPGFFRECTEIMSLEWVKQVFKKTTVCQAATLANDGGRTMTQVKELLVSGANRNYIQRDRLLKMKAKVIGLPIMAAFASDANLLDALVSLDYYAKTARTTADLTKKIDKMVFDTTGQSPGLYAAWKLKTAEQTPTITTLRIDLRKRIAKKVQEAKQVARRAGACGGPVGSGQAPIVPTMPLKPPRMIRRWQPTSPMVLSSLHTRARTSPLSGSKAAPAPACPLTNGPKKTVIPRSKVQTKAAPKKAPRVPVNNPARSPPKSTKKVVPRPATRPRRTPGKAAPPKRATPKRKPKVVPKPTRRPKGHPRTRKGRRK